MPGCSDWPQACPVRCSPPRPRHLIGLLVMQDDLQVYFWSTHAHRSTHTHPANSEIRAGHSILCLSTAAMYVGIYPHVAISIPEHAGRSEARVLFLLAGEAWRFWGGWYIARIPALWVRSVSSKHARTHRPSAPPAHPRPPPPSLIRNPPATGFCGLHHHNTTLTTQSGTRHSSLELGTSTRSTPSLALDIS